MKIQYQISLITILFFSITNSGIAQIVKLENIRQVTIDTFFLTKPVWGPDGRQLLLTGQNNRGLYIYDTVSHTVEILDKNLRVKNKPIWLKNGEIAYSARNKLNFISRFKTTGNVSEDTLIVLNTQKKKVEAVTCNGNLIAEVTPTAGLYYNPVISPDGKKAIIHLGSEMYLYATNGSGMIQKIGTGLASSWSADSKLVFYFLDTSNDGHHTSNSDLYVVNIHTNVHQQLTQSNDITEMWPDVSPDGKNIVFTDSKSGRILMATLKFVEE
ncbi:MAG: PD40 domain-containing protein [Bacteroidales bacterium]|nr:PD40 domain-containing protein [Bacteroidales bacterium]